MNELKIKGHSGCGLRVVEDTFGNLLVEKSCAESYTERLHAQCVKQANASYADTSFDVPAPSWVGGSKMLMPYVHAMSFVEYFERAGKTDIDNLIEALQEYIKAETSQSVLTDVDTKVFMEKVKSVNSNAQKNTVLSDNDKADVEKACAYVISYLMKQDKTIKIFVGTCHGDMTFSNILFKTSGKHALIDFLDSFVETPLQDLVKIRQDTKYGWSLLMTEQSYNEAHVKAVLKYIDERISKAFDDKFLQYYNMMQYINILRIIPYVKEHNVYERLIKILKEIEL